MRKYKIDRFYTNDSTIVIVIILSIFLVKSIINNESMDVKSLITFILTIIAFLVIVIISAGARKKNYIGIYEDKMEVSKIMNLKRVECMIRYEEINSIKYERIISRYKPYYMITINSKSKEVDFKLSMYQDYEELLKTIINKTKTNDGICFNRRLQKMIDKGYFDE